MTREDMRRKRIGVLMGGRSAEREVSLNSGRAVLGALLEMGYQAVGLDVGRDIAERLASERIEVAFICLHGRFGEDGTIQGLLEVMGIPYTGSGVLASALAMNKVVAKVVFAASGLTVAPYRVLRPGDAFDPEEAGFGLPVVVKPSQEGSSVGVSIVRADRELAPALALAWTYDDEILVEKYIKGREIQVGILNDRALGAIEIVPKREFYDFEAKYTAGMAEHILPAPLTQPLYDSVLRQGERAHCCLGCAGYSRVDFLVTEEAECYLLEVNTLPGMTALSLLPEIAQGAGYGFTTLVEEIVCSAALKIKG
ncbi:MAG: D-alanine--D-alanine ligase [Geobacter sp.]|nr:D-alanine--D-alanine ligase [Geobacter sp.]